MENIQNNNEIKECRICLESEDSENMISPCLCNGGQKYVHRNCLAMWRQQNYKAYYTCSTCGFNYRISRLLWGRILANPISAMISTLLGIAIFGIISGHISSSCYNIIYYWLRHMAYRSPHHLQILFHSMLWTGIPGLFLLLKSLITSIPENINLPSPNHRFPLYYPMYYPSNPDNIPPSPTEKKKNEKKIKIAPYESKSSTTWLLLIIGVISSFYHSFKFVHGHCLRLGAKARCIVENI